MTGRVSFLILAFVILAGFQPVRSQRATSFNGFERVDKNGDIRKPADYRDRYELVGRYMVLDPKGDQMHVTYASPARLRITAKPESFPTAV
jgi:hypothetical protein